MDFQLNEAAAKKARLIKTLYAIKMSVKISQIGGARVGGFNASWPFASLKVTGDQITLSVFSKKYEIEKGKINSIKRYRGLFSTGLKIEHSKNEMPEHLIFWTFSFNKLKQALEEIGYSVDA